MKFYKRDPDRAISGMAELSLKQRGAYNSLIDLLYSRDGDLPDDDRRVAKMMTCHWREWATIKLQLMAVGKVWVEGGKLHARRVQETIKEASDFAQDQRQRALKGWANRKNDNEINDCDMPPGNASTATPIAREEKPSVSPPYVPPPNGAHVNGSQPRKPVKIDLATWEPCDEARKYAIDRNLDPAAVREQIRDWAANAPAGKRLKLDPIAFWRGWCRRDAERRAEADRRSGATRPRAGGILDAAAAVLARRRNGQHD